MTPMLLGFVALLVVAGTTALWFRKAFRLAIPQNRTPFVLAMLLGGGLGVLALAEGAGWSGGVPAGLAIFGALFLCFTVAISAQRVSADALGVGETLPRFTAPDEHGATFDSAALAGKPVLLKFFRGHW